MLFFLQLDFRPEFGTPFVGGSHFLVFACCQHDDIASIYLPSGNKLPPRFWERSNGHYQLLLNRPGQPEVVLEEDDRLVPHTLSFSKQREQLDATSFEYDVGAEVAKIGGVPNWIQHPSEYRCCCGAPMRYFSQLPEYFEFPKTDAAPSQTNWASGDSYVLFLGNAVYFFACEQQCSPFAVIAVMQN